MNDPTPNFTPMDASLFPWVTAGILILIGVFSLTAFLLRRKITMRGVMALHLLNLLVVLSGYFALFNPRGPLHGTIAVILLLSLLRALSKFENTDKS